MMRDFEFAFTPQGNLALVMSPGLVRGLLTLQEEYEASEHQLHRTPVEDIEADIFDRLEVEMANDAIQEAAKSAASFSNVVAADGLRQQLTDDNQRLVVINFTSPEIYNSYLMWFNSLYTFARRGELEGFVVGTAQDDGFDNKDLPLLTRYVSTITGVLADVGINAARAIAELKQDEDDS